MEVVAVIGASNDRSRYAYKAMEMLTEYGNKPVPVHPWKRKFWATEWCKI
jgi:predicted CoA-binding protein